MHYILGSNVIYSGSCEFLRSVMQVLNTICTKHCTKSCMKHELSCMILLHAWTHMFMHEPMLNLFSLHDSEGTCTFLDHNLVQNHKIMWFHALSCTFMQEVAGSCTYLENHARLAYPIDFCPIRTFIVTTYPHCAMIWSSFCVQRINLQGQNLESQLVFRFSIKLAEGWPTGWWI